jgi:hypothetical protein
MEGEEKMAYDDTKDKLIKEWKFEGLYFSVHQYKDGPRKLQIGPREVDSLTFSKAGRLSLAEFEKLCELKDEILKELKG